MNINTGDRLRLGNTCQGAERVYTVNPETPGEIVTARNAYRADYLDEPGAEIAVVHSDGEEDMILAGWVEENLGPAEDPSLYVGDLFTRLVPPGTSREDAADNLSRYLD